MPRPERVFTLRELTRLLRLTPKRAGQLRRLGVLRGDEAGYRFRELVSARVASALLEGGATVRQVREALDGARRLAPDALTPLAELRLVVQDQKIVVEHDRMRLDPRTGQALLDFESGDLERETVESLLMGMLRPLIPPADAAEIWFARASAWDGDPERWEAAVEAYERVRSEEHTSELQSHHDLVCRLLLEKKKIQPLRCARKLSTKFQIRSSMRS